MSGRIEIATLGDTLDEIESAVNAMSQAEFSEFCESGWNDLDLTNGRVKGPHDQGLNDGTGTVAWDYTEYLQINLYSDIKNIERMSFDGEKE